MFIWPLSPQRQHACERHTHCNISHCLVNVCVWSLRCASTCVLAALSEPARSTMNSTPVLTFWHTFSTQLCCCTVTYQQITCNVRCIIASIVQLVEQSWTVSSVRSQSSHLQDGVRPGGGLVDGRGFTGAAQAASTEETHHFLRVLHLQLCEPRDGRGSVGVLPEVEDPRRRRPQQVPNCLIVDL